MGEGEGEGEGEARWGKNILKKLDSSISKAKD